MVEGANPDYWQVLYILGKSLRVIAMFETSGQAVLTQVCILQVPSLGIVQRMLVTSQVNEQVVQLAFTTCNIAHHL